MYYNFPTNASTAQGHQQIQIHEQQDFTIPLSLKYRSSDLENQQNPISSLSDDTKKVSGDQNTRQRKNHHYTPLDSASIPSSSTNGTTGGEGEEGSEESTEIEVEIVDDEEFDEQQAASRVVIIYPKDGKEPCSITIEDLKALGNRQMINDSIIDFYLKWIYNELMLPNRRNKTFIFNSFFYGRLVQFPVLDKRKTYSDEEWEKQLGTNYQRLRSWTKNVDLFKMEYVIVPVNEMCHWYLAVIVSPGTGLVKEDQYPMRGSGLGRQRSFLIIFDSLLKKQRKGFPLEDSYCDVRESIAEYLYLEAREKRRDRVYFNKNSLEIVVPKGLPQQSNSIDCGLYLLHFAETFLEKPPNPGVLKPGVEFNHLYHNFQFPNKREGLKNLITMLAPSVKDTDFENSKRKAGKRAKAKRT